MIQPALESAERERVRLDAADSRIHALGLQGTDFSGRISSLEGTGVKLGAEQQGTSDRLEMAIKSISELSASLGRTDAHAKEEGERLDDAFRNIEELSQGSIDAQTSLRSMQVSMEDTQKATEQQGALGSSLADHIEALRHGLEVTDGEVQGIRDYLGINVAALD